MEIEFKNLADDTLYAKPQGRIDTLTAVDFGTAVTDRLDNIKKLILDFVDVEYVSSMGLRVLLELQKTMSAQGVMMLKDVNPEVLKVFEMTGFSKILQIV